MKESANNCFNLTRAIVMVPAEILAQELRQCPSQVKRMFDGSASRSLKYGVFKGVNKWIINLSKYIKKQYAEIV
jgi:hypothetical protein